MYLNSIIYVTGSISWQQMFSASVGIVLQFPHVHLLKWANTEKNYDNIIKGNLEIYQ